MGEMQSKSDAQLLRDYAQGGLDGAFSELVQRHTDLVYSAALRQVETPEAAADIAQGVFIVLARGAGELAPRLTDEASLAGWLCRTARNLSLNLRRGEFRRQSRERHAMEQLISATDTAPDWERLRPMLDEAMSELEETDYDAIVLRFYRDQDFRAVGTAIGLSDDAAQKRVSRALDKLRDLLARRGIRTTGAALAAAITANAIHAAPMGLASSISGAAITAVAGASFSASAITKGIAMTTLQKTIIAASVAILTGAGFYEARQASQLRTRVQDLQQQQSQLSADLQQLRRERNEATNHLARVLANITEPPAPPVDTEVLKLRGQIGMLRQELAVTQAKINSSGGFAGVMHDPKMRAYMLATQRNTIRVKFKDLFKELKLTPEQTEQVIQVMCDRLTANTERLYSIPQGVMTQAQIDQASADRWAGLKADLLPILGEDGWARFKAHTDEQPGHATVELLNGRLGASQLTDVQNNQLFKLVKAEPFDLTRGISGDWDPAFWGAQEDIDNHLLQIADSNQRILQQAGSFLTPDQLSQLSLVLSNGINERIAQAAAFVQKQ